MIGFKPRQTVISLKRYLSPGNFAVIVESTQSKIQSNKVSPLNAFEIRLRLRLKLYAVKIIWTDHRLSREGFWLVLDEVDRPLTPVSFKPMDRATGNLPLIPGVRGISDN